MKVTKLLILVFLFFAGGCANRVVPTGGAKDVIPPKLISAVPENSTINFSSKEITLNFSEYMQLKDLPSQLLVSPLMDPLPIVRVSKRSIIVKLPEKLRKNTTYTINFGKAIADLHEGNSLDNFQYVFSTGSILDSLQCIGVVKDAGTLSNVKDVTVMLYLKTDSVSIPDSLIFNKKPDYFTHTNENGFFKINNIAEGNYFIYALEDKNNNYILDNLKDEHMAFTNKICVIPQKDSINLLLSIQQPAKAQFLKAQLVVPYKVVLLFNSSIDSLSLFDLSTNKDFAGRKEWSKYKDSLFVFMNDTITDSLNLVIKSNTSINDTIHFKVKSVNNSSKRFGKSDFRMEIKSSPSQLGSTASLVLESARPIAKISNGMQLFIDSVLISSDSYTIKRADSLSQTIELIYKWKEGGNYRFRIPSGELTDLYGITNDTLDFRFKIPSTETSASLSIQTTNLIDGKNYLLQLLNSKFELVLQQVIHNSGKYEFNYIFPGSYVVRVVDDRNNNGKLDFSDYLKGIQSEEVFVSNPAQLRANWELELELNCTTKQ